MRIAHVISTPAGVGGAEKTLAQLVQYGHVQGWDQLVLNPFALAPDDGTARSFYAPADYRAKRCSSVPRLPSLRRWLSTELRSFCPDIVHAHLFHASVLVASLRRPSGARLVLSHQHGDHFEAMGAPVRRLADRLAGRRYDQVVGCSQSVAKFLISSYGYAPDRVSFVHNGWDGHPAPRNGDDGSLICVARFREQKNHRLLIDAVLRIRERIPDVKLRLIGDGETRSEIEEYVSRSGARRNVEFLGSITDVWPLLARARVFALPSSWEPLGIAALEAMAAGLPVVVTAVGGLREIVQDGENGFLVSPTSTVDLADRLTLLLTDDDLAHQMGARGQRIAEQYRAERTAGAYAGIYSRLLEHPGA
jgi:glycosyltransferase involved in cell wall biosynthesis